MLYVIRKWGLASYSGIDTFGVHKTVKRRRKSITARKSTNRLEYKTLDNFWTIMGSDDHMVIGMATIL